MDIGESSSVVPTSVNLEVHCDLLGTIIISKIGECIVIGLKHWESPIGPTTNLEAQGFQSDKQNYLLNNVE